MFPTLLTPRLRLREMQQTDCVGYAALLTDDDAYFIADVPVTPELVPSKIERNRLALEERRAVYWSVTRAEGFVGFVALHVMTSRTPALSYAVSKGSRRQGVATEALSAVVDFAFAQLDVECLLASTHLENHASAQLLRSLRFHDVGVAESAGGPRRYFRLAFRTNG